MWEEITSCREIPESGEMHEWEEITEPAKVQEWERFPSAGKLQSCGELQFCEEFAKVRKTTKSSWFSLVNQCEQSFEQAGEHPGRRWIDSGEI